MYATSAEIHQYERDRKRQEEILAGFDDDVRRAQGDYDRSGLPGQSPTFRIRIHKRPPRPVRVDVGVKEAGT